MNGRGGRSERAAEWSLGARQRQRGRDWDQWQMRGGRRRVAQRCVAGAPAHLYHLRKGGRGVRDWADHVLRWEGREGGVRGGRGRRELGRGTTERGGRALPDGAKGGPKKRERGARSPSGRGEGAGRGGRGAAWARCRSETCDGELVGWRWGGSRLGANAQNRPARGADGSRAEGGRIAGGQRGVGRRMPWRRRGG